MSVIDSLYKQGDISFFLAKNQGFYLFIVYSTPQNSKNFCFVSIISCIPQILTLFSFSFLPYLTFFSCFNLLHFVHLFVCFSCIFIISGVLAISDNVPIIQLLNPSIFFCSLNKLFHQIFI